MTDTVSREELGPRPSPVEPYSPDLPVKQSPIRLDFIDGIRAIAALYVAVFHIQHWRNAQQFVVMPLRWLPLNFGHYAVDAFIVLSGFCLTLSVAKRGGKLAGYGDFMFRRARRILPAYYGAVLFSLGILWIREWSGLGHRGDTVAMPVTPAAVGAHLLLVHNFASEWITRINGPLWSIAVEWQLYLVFPVVVLAAYRFGPWRTALALALAGVATHYLPGHPMDMTVPWFAGLFAAGAGAAVVCFDPRDRWARIRNRWRWDLVFAGTCSIVALMAVLAKKVLLKGASGDGLEFALDPLVGAIVTALLIWLTLSDHYSVGGRVRGLLSVGPLVAIGGFSYSIYLLHAPLVDLCARALSATIPWTSRDALFGLLIVCLAPIVGIAWVFSIVLEKPFLGPPQKKLMEAQRRPAD